MTFFKKSISAVAVMSLMTGVAMAADIDPPAQPIAPAAKNDNFYISIFAGGNPSVGDESFSNGDGLLVDIDRDNGFSVGGAVGYKWNSFNFDGITPRTEIEFSYFNNDVDQLDFSGNGAGNEILIGDTDVTGFNVLANLYLDFDHFSDTGFTPYIVGGLGVSVVDLDLVYNPAAPFALNLDDRSTNFLWSVGAGTSYALSDSVSLFGDARFQQAINVDSVRRGGGTPGVNGGTFEEDLSNVALRAGLSYKF
ncbi:MAG: outer membrane beta-barrel protein [Hyphomicrobiales bacterium]